MTDIDHELKKKAADFTLEWAKNIIAIASAALVLSATFIKDIATPPIVNAVYLQVSWILLIASVILGVVVISGLIAQLNKADITVIDIYAGTIRLPALFQVLFILAGMILLALFSWSNF
jgi:hypothetical protein